MKLPPRSLLSPHVPLPEVLRPALICAGRSGAILVSLALLSTGLFAQQDDATRNLELREADQRAWIARTRTAYDAQFKQQEIACYRRFAVNDCLLDSRRTQREVLADLRRQEILLNDAQRKRRAAEQLLRTDEKLSSSPPS